MKKQYKIVLNVVVDDPDTPYPAGGDYTHLTKIQGIIHELLWAAKLDATVTLDKVIEKGALEVS